MAEQAKEIKIEIGKQKVVGSPVYAVNKAGDFSVVSVREKDWPSNAEEKQDLKEINSSKSDGAKRFEDVVARVIQLGDIPRGLQFNSPRASNDDRDNAMGVITLPVTDLQERYEDRMKDLGDIINQASNPVTVFPWVSYKATLKDENDPKALPKAPKDRKKSFESADAVPSVIQKGKGIIQISAPKNTDLKVL